MYLYCTYFCFGYLSDYLGLCKGTNMHSLRVNEVQNVYLEILFPFYDFFILMWKKQYINML